LAQFDTIAYIHLGLLVAGGPDEQLNRVAGVSRSAKTFTPKQSQYLAFIHAYRTLLAFRSKDRAMFLYGFAKSEGDNIEEDELTTLQEIAAAWLAADVKRIENAIANKILEEVQNEQDAKQSNKTLAADARLARDGQGHEGRRCFDRTRL